MANRIITFSNHLWDVTPSSGYTAGWLTGVDVSPVTSDDQPRGQPLRGSALSEAVRFNLPLSLRGRGNAFRLPLGLTVISGGTAVGKSTFARSLQLAFDETQTDRLEVLNAVEPFDTDEMARWPWFASADDALAAAVAMQMDDARTLPVIDSLRSVLFEMVGAATDKGMVAKFFTQLTRVSNALAMNGRTVLATVNPMSTAPDVVEEFLRRMSAALPALIVLEGRTDSGYAGYTTLRSAETNRAKIEFTMVDEPVITVPSVTAESEFPASSDYRTATLASIPAVRALRENTI